MDAPCYTDSGHTDARRHLHIIAGIADHYRLVRLQAEVVENLHEHGGVRFGAGFVSTTGHVKPGSELTGLERQVQPAATFAGSNGAVTLVKVQPLQDLSHALEHALVIGGGGHKVTAVGLAHRSHLL